MEGWIYKGLIFIASILGLRWIYRIFARQDGDPKMSLREFQQLAAFVLFYGSYIYIIITEANRTTEAHVFDGTWFAMVITGLFTVLHMEDILDKVKALIEAMIRFRTSTPQPENIPPAT